MHGKDTAFAVETKTPNDHLLKLLSVLCPQFLSLPKDPRTLLETAQDYEVPNKACGEYYYFGLEKGIKTFTSELLHQHAEFFNSPNGKIQLQINFDGLPILQSANTQFWPILGKIIHQDDLDPFVIGLFCGKGKPSKINEYLGYFVSELRLTLQEGIKITGLQNNVGAYVSSYICDAPARAFVKQTKPHNAYFGCDKCVLKGE
ncbi:uncharacterized protein LOC125043067 [Penaeus chinensis]|uniref:uncharacterized protein LOC125043067 n=1 Tax=Penaeus chinensis TaxID=139456 RepID=UPI001FB66DF8|nr:uncharacterized protein LOC125043067 [Penaeus chinensis]